MIHDIYKGALAKKEAAFLTVLGTSIGLALGVAAGFVSSGLSTTLVGAAIGALTSVLTLGVLFAVMYISNKIEASKVPSKTVEQAYGIGSMQR